MLNIFGYVFLLQYISLPLGATSIDYNTSIKHSVKKALITLLQHIACGYEQKNLKIFCATVC